MEIQGISQFCLDIYISSSSGEDHYRCQEADNEEIWIKANTGTSNKRGQFNH